MPDFVKRQVHPKKHFKSIENRKGWQNKKIYSKKWKVNSPSKAKWK